MGVVIRVDCEVMVEREVVCWILALFFAMTAEEQFWKMTNLKRRLGMVRE